MNAIRCPEVETRRGNFRAPTYRTAIVDFASRWVLPSHCLLSAQHGHERVAHSDGDAPRG